MIESLDVVRTSLQIAGRECPFVTLKLSQSYNAHHEFSIRLNYSALGGVWMSNPKELISLVGERVVIEMRHSVNDAHNLFVGIVTNVSMAGTDGVDTSVILTGKSESVYLDGKRAMDSYTDTTLENVVKQAVRNAGERVSMDIRPRHDFTIDYLCQYDETDFEFLNRLSWIYGEDFYYTGTTLKFGRDPYYKGELLTLTYDVNLTSLELCANLVPARFNRYAYLPHQDNEVDAVPQDSVEGLRGYLSDSLRRSDSIYTAEGDLPSEAPVNTLRELTRLVNIERGRAVAGMFTLKGTSRTCEVKLGCEVLVKMPESAPIGRKEVEEFQIVSVVHEVDERGYYRNSFTGVLSKLPAVPMSPVAAPRTGVQQGTVYRNDDPLGKGRVQVQLQWQKGLGKTTNWLRVQTPDAGSSDKVESNRGFVCIPEVGDTVVVGFDFGDPNRPFVMGSLFSEVTGAGGGEGNKGKSITSRSGCAMMLDDAKGSMTLRDKGTASMDFDGAGKVKTRADSSSETSVGEDASVLKMDSSGMIDLSGKTSVTIKVGSSSFMITEDTVTINSKNINVIGENNTVTGTTNQVNGETNIEGQTVTITGKPVKIN